MRVVGGTGAKKGRKAGTVSQANPFDKAARYDPRAWPQEAKDLLMPLISPATPLSEDHVGQFIEALVNDWRSRQPTEFWQEINKLAEVKNKTSPGARASRINVELRKYLARELADITQVGPRGYMQSKVQTIKWMMEMSLERPYLVRSESEQYQDTILRLMSIERFSAQFGIPLSTYVAAGDESDADPDSGAVISRLKGLKLAHTKLVMIPVEKGGSGESFQFFDPAHWPAYAVESFGPLVTSTLPWDEDRARGCLGDLIHAILRFQSHGFLQDLKTAGSGARTDLVWQRLAQTLEDIVGYAGNRSVRPNSFSSTVRWIEKVYNDPSRGLVKGKHRHSHSDNSELTIAAKYRAQFLPPISPGTQQSVQPTASDSSASSGLGSIMQSHGHLQGDRSLVTPLDPAIELSDTIEEALDPVVKVEMEGLSHDPVNEDPEVILDRLLVATWKSEKLKAQAEGRAVRPANTPFW
jgi:hypothetical protein